MSTIADNVVDTAIEAPRRSRWGRLYHGETSFDFMGRKWWGLGLSAVILIAAIISLFAQGLNLGLDFEGGVQWDVPAATITKAQAADVLDANGIDGGNAKITTLSGGDINLVRIQVPVQTPEQNQVVLAALAKQANIDVNLISSNSVSKSWGDAITNKAIKALIVFLILVAIFIAWRFEWWMALAAILAMIHDVLISVGVYSIFQFEVTPATVIAFLTILGFSLYDTLASVRHACHMTTSSMFR
jgi:preprotein translocase subunit SecF